MLSTIKFIAQHPMNRLDRIGAFSRFIRWQISSRVVGKEIILPFVNDVQMIVRRGMTGATGNWYCGLHEISEMAFVIHYLRPDDLFVDIGANVGSYSLLASGAVKSRTIAIEPIPATYRDLVRNIKLNSLENLVQARCIGISKESGTLKFTSSLDTMNRIALDNETGPVISVPVERLDTVLAGGAPVMMKIDVEGHEANVIEGAISVFESETLQAVIMETNGSGEKFGYSNDFIVKKMESFGFKPYRYDPFSRKLAIADRSVANTIFLRNCAEATDRCQNAPKFTLVNGSI